MSTPSHPASPRALRVESLPPLPLDSGEQLRHARMAFHLDGTLAPRRDNVVLVLHALTGSADAAGEWWRGLIGPGLALDTTRFAVLSPNLLGSCYGSTGPQDWGDGAFPALTVRDLARGVALLLERLGVPRVALVTGGSLGGMVALEFGASFPDRADQGVVFAAPARLGAGAIAWSHAQRRALDLGGSEGLHLAREIAMLSYRTARGLDARFGRRRAAVPAVPRAEAWAETAETFEAQAWLRAHGQRLAARFDARTYRCLLAVMDSHDLGESRGGIAERLRASGTRWTGVGIPGDLFCPPEDVQAWVRAAGGTYRTIESLDGHDAFLTERVQVGAILTAALGGARGRPAEVA
jgi:homoserine O-acetyltransferase